MSNLSSIFNIISSPDDFRGLAQKYLPPFIFNYIDGGAGEEITLRESRSDLRKVKLAQNVLIDMSNIDPSTTLLGRKMSLPIVLGPVGMAGIYASRGEVQAAKAASAKGIPMCLSTMSVCPLEEVAPVMLADKKARAEKRNDPPDTVPKTPDDFWFQLYLMKDHNFAENMMTRAEALGIKTLVLTVDFAAAGKRYRDNHSGLAGPFAKMRQVCQAVSHPVWAIDAVLFGRPWTLGNLALYFKGNATFSDLMSFIGSNIDPSMSWKDVDLIRRRWKGDLVLKGIMSKEDAQRAVKAKADGIVVSNHGGRQLDSVPSTASVLPDIAQAVKGKTTVFVDGGVRSGLDVVKMLALGADGVFLGRAWAYALAAKGQEGVSHLLNLMESEIVIGMTLTGAHKISDIDASKLA